MNISARLSSKTSPKKDCSSCKKPQAESSSRKKRNLFRRLDARFPFLKVTAIIILGTLMILDFADLTISKTGDPNPRKIVAPMLEHLKATERPDRVLEGKKLVALTFDDGPSPETTPNLVGILYEKNAPSTFFMLGSKMRTYPEIVKLVAEKGNEIGSHTYSHQNLIRISAPAVAEDIRKTNAAFSEILGKLPSLTRPPYGNINGSVRASAGTPLILWSVDTLDWKYKTTESIMNYVRNQVYDGAIILMHDIHPTSVAAVETVIDSLRADNYEFVTVSELAKLRGANLVSGAAYYSFRP